MAIDRDLRDRMELELAGYRSAKWIGMHADWIFWDDNMEKAVEKGLFEVQDNGRERISNYYRLTPKGRAALNRVGKDFTYGDSRGRRPVHYTSGDRSLTRWIKVTPAERRNNALRLLDVFKHLVTSAQAHGQLELERAGWFPDRTVIPPPELIKKGYVKVMYRGDVRPVSYYCLTSNGRKVLVSACLRRLLVRQAEECKVFKARQAAELKKFLADQASERNRLPRKVTVCNWDEFPGVH